MLSRLSLSQRGEEPGCSNAASWQAGGWFAESGEVERLAERMMSCILACFITVHDTF
jgi:hypothetical protein